MQLELPKKVGDASFLETFEVRLPQPLSELIKLKMSLLTAVELDYIMFKGPFQIKPVYDFITRRGKIQTTIIYTCSEKSY